MRGIRILRCGRCGVELGASSAEWVHGVVREHAKTCGKPRTLFPIQGRREFVAYSDREKHALAVRREAEARKGAKGVTIQRDGTRVYH